MTAGWLYSGRESGLKDPHLLPPQLRCRLVTLLLIVCPPCHHLSLARCSNQISILRIYSIDTNGAGGSEASEFALSLEQACVYLPNICLLGGYPSMVEWKWYEMKIMKKKMKKQTKSSTSSKFLELVFDRPYPNFCAFSYFAQSHFSSMRVAPEPLTQG